MNTVCVVNYRCSEKDVHHKGILVETTNPYTNDTNQIIIGYDCRVITNIYDFVRDEKEGCFKYNNY